MGLIAECRTELGEASAVFWTDQQIVDSLNEAQVCLVADHPRILETSVNLSIGTNTHFVDVPSSIMIPKSIQNDDAELVPFCSYVDLENYSPDWSTVATGKPERFVLVSHNRMRVFPRADVAYTFTMTGIPWLTELTTVADTLTFHKDLQDAIVYYAVANLFVATRPDMAAAYFEQYAASVMRYMISYRARMSHNTIRLRPGTTRTRTQRGAVNRWRTY